MIGQIHTSSLDHVLATFDLRLYHWPRCVAVGASRYARHKLVLLFQLQCTTARGAASAITAISKGTVNEPTTFPPPSKTHGSYHWAFERLLSAALLPMTAAAFATSGTAYPVLDGLLGVSLVMHSHIGVGHIDSSSVSYHSVLDV